MTTQERGLKRIVWFMAGFLIIGIVIFFARVPIFRGIGSFLAVQDELKKANVIVVLSGDNKRVDEAVSLYKQGLSGQIIMSGGINDTKISLAEMMKQQAVTLGVSQERIILEPKAQHTYEHPIFIKPIMQAYGFKSAIIISSPYHMRRSVMLFERAFKKSGIELIYYPVQDSWFDADNWWTNAASRKVVASEYLKMAVNFFGNGFSRFVGRIRNK